MPRLKPSACSSQWQEPKKPLTLRRRRQRVEITANWDYFYWQFFKDHSRPDLLWNHKVCGCRIFACSPLLTSLHARRAISTDARGAARGA